MISAVVPSGSAASRSAPASASARTPARAPLRAASISAVKPPRGSAVNTIVAASSLIFGNSGTFERAFEVGAARGEQRDDRGVVLGGRPHQRRLAVPGLARVDVGAGASSSRTALRPAGARGDHQHGLAVGVAALASAPAFSSSVDDRRAAVDGGQRQRRHAVAVRRVDLRAGAEQRLHELEASAGPPSAAPSCRRLRPRSPAPLLRQRPHGRGVAALDGIDQTGVARRRRSSRATRQHDERQRRRSVRSSLIRCVHARS